jgi:N-acetylglucosamine-6-phosphate deacetylase
MRDVFPVALSLAAIGGLASAQPAPTNGMRQADLRAHAIVGATVHTGPGRVLEDATLIIRDGVIEAVGQGLEVPPGTWRWPGHGLTVYPGLIDAALLVDAPRPPAGPGDHWSDRVRPQVDLSEQAVPPPSMRKEMRALGFTAAAVHPRDGIFRGSGVVVALAEDATHVLAYRTRVAMAAGLDHGGAFGSASYPGSLMGAIALFRQTILDARWHAECRSVYAAHPQGNEPPARADALRALEDAALGRQAILLEVDDEHDALRAARLAHEFDLNMVLLGSGYEFRRLDEIAATGLALIVPLDFPKRPQIDSLAAAENVSLRDMMTWEQAPTNPRRLIERGVPVALTTHRQKSISDFPRRLHEAIKHGLSEDQALEALTTAPARLLGLDHVLGTLEPGKAANLVVVDGSLFAEKPKVREVWINGRRHEVDPAPRVTLALRGTLHTDMGVECAIEVDTVKRSVTLRPAPGDKPVSARQVVVQQDQISFVVEGRALGGEGYSQLSGAIVRGEIVGSGEMSDGRRFGFTVALGPAEAPAAAAPAPVTAAAAAGGGTGGRFELTMRGERGEMPATLNVTIEPGGSARGTLSVRDRERDLGTGTFMPGSGELRFAYTGPGGEPASLEARLSGDEIEGRSSFGSMQATFTGRRGAAGAGASAFQMPPEDLVSPLGAYGLTAAPAPRNVLVRGATIWTCGPEGVLDGADLLVVDGRIRAVGRNLGGAAGGPDLLIIDGAGKHVTPGLIDCHSHTGINGGVNEWAQANTAEVRIGDVIDPDDIDWYRELAGGLTAANQLHGSANPIGGQNSVVKLKWGSGAAAFPIADAPPGIKFALGENVKRSEGRYPNTRMGVETFIRDAFAAARDHEAEWARYAGLPTEAREATMPPRRDLELETLSEILAGRRLVHCHSYRQDEILMLIRVAEDFGFTIGTFQHVLEGYKVADAIAAHGAGASSFSDWWAYKMEVMDAIPYNGALMAEVGVLVSFNSDSDELARRMNTEAAKAVRYGGMEPQEALKLVTINPARQLRVDHRTGSLEPGKDADFVVWSDHPLSTYARCEETWVEGARLFDLEADRQMRERDAGERRRLIQKILSEAHGEPPRVVQAEEPASPAAEARRRWLEDLARRGIQPDEIRPGCCADHREMWNMREGR